MHKLKIGMLITGICLPWFVSATIGPEPSSGAARDFNAPALPSSVQLISDGRRVEMTWVDPLDSDFYFVEILRNDGNGTAVTGDVRIRIGKSVQRYEDTEVRTGETYRYRLRVGDTSLNTRLSDEYEVAVRVALPPAAVVTTPPPAAAPVITPAPMPVAAVNPPAVLTPSVNGVGEELYPGTFAYGFRRVRALSLEQALSKSLAQGLNERLPGVFNRLFHQKTGTFKQWWYGYVNAYVYGGYTLDEIKQSVRFGGKTVHPTIPASVWRNSADYQAYINR